MGYLDDIFLTGDSYNQFKKTVLPTSTLFLKLGFLIHLENHATSNPKIRISRVCDKFQTNGS